MSKKHKQHEQSEEKKEQEIEIDFSKIKRVFTNPTLIVIVLLLIPMFLAGYFRYYPANLPIAEEWAESSIQNSLSAQIAQEVNAQYPNLPDANKQQIINEKVQEFIAQNKEAYDNAVKQNADAIRQQFKDENGVNYLSDIDTWFYYRQVRNMVDTGHAYDEIRADGKAYDTHKIAPLGEPMQKEFKGATLHVWLGFFTHKIVTFFNSDASVMGTFFYVSILVSVLSVIPAFFLARKVAGNVGGFFAAVIIAVHPAFLGRTMGGVVDTDAYNIFFPLLISWLFIEAFEKEDLKKKLIWGGFAGFAAGLYSFAWAGWWYVYDLILIAMVGYIVYYIILHRNEFKKGAFIIFRNKNIKDAGILLLVFLIFSGIFITFFNSFDTFLKAPIAPLESLSIKAATNPSLWPNVLTTVAELNAASVPQIIDQIGGKLLFIIALVGIIFTMKISEEWYKWLLFGSVIIFGFAIFLQDKISLYLFLVILSLPIIIGLLIPLFLKQEGMDIKYALFMTLWFMGTIFTATKGVRFVLLLVPVFGVAFGIAVGKIYEWFSEWFSKEFEMNITATKLISLLVLLILLIAPVRGAHNTAKREIPLMNDGWYQSLERIRDSSQPNAIINSWWDFGHWFKAIGDRAVTFDGASQNTPMAHWMGKTLLTSDEDEAIGILRMLDCNSNNAYEELMKTVKDEHKTVELLYKVVSLNKENAIKTLQDYMTKEEAERFTEKYTHCAPPENYFITSEDMVGKSGVWAHFGSWDFRRAEIWQNYRELPLSEFVEKAKSELGYDEKTATDLYYQVQTITDESTANTWIAPWPSYMSGQVSCSENSQEIRCQNGLIINKTNFEAWVPTSSGNLNPRTLVYIDEDGKFQAKHYDKGKVLTTQDGRFIGAALIRNGNSYSSILMEDTLSESMFTKLFYFDGAGVEHFEKFSDTRAVTGDRIIVWKVKWE